MRIKTTLRIIDFVNAITDNMPSIHSALALILLPLVIRYIVVAICYAVWAYVLAMLMQPLASTDDDSSSSPASIPEQPLRGLDDHNARNDESTRESPSNIRDFSLESDQANNFSTAATPPSTELNGLTSFTPTSSEEQALSDQSRSASVDDLLGPNLRSLPFSPPHIPTPYGPFLSPTLFGPPPLVENLLGIHIPPSIGPLLVDIRRPSEPNQEDIDSGRFEHFFDQLFGWELRAYPTDGEGRSGSEAFSTLERFFDAATPHLATLELVDMAIFKAGIPPYDHRPIVRTPRLRSFTWSGSAVGLPRPWFTLASVDFEHVTNLTLNCPLTITDARMVLHRCRNVVDLKLGLLTDLETTIPWQTPAPKELHMPLLRSMEVMTRVDLCAFFANMHCRSLIKATLNGLGRQITTEELRLVDSFNSRVRDQSIEVAVI